MLFADKLLGDPQSQAAASAFFGREQRFKDSASVLFGYAWTIVGKENAHAASRVHAAYVFPLPHVARTGMNSELSGLVGHAFQRVEHDVGKNLAYRPGIALDGFVKLITAVNGNALVVDLGSVGVQHVVQNVRDPDRRDAFFARQCQRVTGDAQGARKFSLGVAYPFPRLGLEILFVIQQKERVGDTLKRVLHLMNNAGGKQAYLSQSPDFFISKAPIFSLLSHRSLPPRVMASLRGTSGQKRMRSMLPEKREEGNNPQKKYPLKGIAPTVFGMNKDTRRVAPNRACTELAPWSDALFAVYSMI